MGLWILAVCFEAQFVVPRRVRRPRFTRSREIRPAPSLHRGSTDALIIPVPPNAGHLSIKNKIPCPKMSSVGGSTIHSWRLRSKE